MVKVFFAIIVASPEIGVNLCPVDHVVSNHLETSDFCAVTHYKCPNVFRPALVKAQHPNYIFMAAFGMVSEFRLIYLDSHVVVAQLIPLIMVLEVNVYQMPNPPVNIVNVLVLEMGYLVLPQISERL